jgi:hypothetical protein
MTRYTVIVDDHMREGLRALAESERDYTGRASVAAVIRRLVARRLAERTPDTGAD